MQSAARNQIIGLAAIILIAMGLGIWLLVPHDKTSPPATTQVQQSTTYDGLDQLLNVGATASVVGDFKLAMHGFLVENPPLIQTVGLSNVQQQHDFENGNDDYTFDLTTLGGTFQAKLTTSSLETASLALQQSGKTIYQSAAITVTSTD